MCNLLWHLNWKKILVISSQNSLVMYPVGVTLLCLLCWMTVVFFYMAGVIHFACLFSHNNGDHISVINQYHSCLLEDLYSTVLMQCFHLFLHMKYAAILSFRMIHSILFIHHCSLFIRYLFYAVLTLLKSITSLF